MADSKDNILEVKHAVKRFGGLIAVNDVSLDVHRGEILGLIGPNGAGKTTAFNGIAGADKYTSGKVIFDCKDVSNLGPHRRCELGIGRTFQITKPFENMSVLQNVSVGGLFGTPHRNGLFSLESVERCEAEAETILQFLELDSKKDLMAGKLNVAERKRLELCRALATKPKLLLLDEVIAGLNPSEVGGMVEMVRRINDRGISILMIEHVMQAVKNACSRVAVLCFGKLIAEDTPEAVMANPEVIEAYLGKRKVLDA